jgi:hypothetical protein
MRIARKEDRGGKETEKHNSNRGQEHMQGRKHAAIGMVVHCAA